MTMLVMVETKYNITDKCFWMNCLHEIKDAIQIQQIYKNMSLNSIPLSGLHVSSFMFHVAFILVSSYEQTLVHVWKSDTSL